MSCVPLGLNSCSIVFRAPDGTQPPGRLQADLRLYDFGAISEFCDADQCSTGSRGVGICLLNVDQSVGVDPAICASADYINPLRISTDNKLWIDIQRPDETTCKTVDNQGAISSGSSANSAIPMGSPIESDTIENDSSCDDITVRRKVTILNSSIINPPPVVDNEGNETPAQVHLEFFDSATGQTVQYLGACSGSCPVGSMTVDLEPVTLAPGDSHMSTITPQLFTTTAAGGSFEVMRGQYRVCTTVVYGVDEVACP